MVLWIIYHHMWANHRVRKYHILTSLTYEANQKVTHHLVSIGLSKPPCIPTYNPGKGNWVVRSSTLHLKSFTLSIKEKSVEATNFMKSWSFDPVTICLASSVICTPSWIKSAMAINSFSVNPLVVIAGDPMRIPPGTRALLSPVHETKAQI